MSEFTNILFDNEARLSLKKGVDELADAVKTTLGPSGRCVIIEQANANPKVTKDGVSISREVKPKDKFARQGAKLIQEVASKTCSDAGDGTTTATVLAQSLVEKGMTAVSVGASATEIKLGMEYATSKVLDFLKTKAIPVDETTDQLYNIAMISSNGDEEIAKLITEAISKVTKDGIITISKSDVIESTLQISEGLDFNTGFVSPYFINVKEKNIFEDEDALVLIADKDLVIIDEFYNILKEALATGKSLVIIAQNIESQALKTLIYNRVQAEAKICAIKAPYYGDKRHQFLEDLAAFTGATIISDDKGTPASSANMSFLGKVKKITATKDKTVLIAETSDKLKAHIETLKALVSSQKDKLQKELAQDRLAKLLGGVAIIKVGSISEAALHERQDRVEDALLAVKAAIEEGIVEGGGSFYVKAAEVLKKSKPTGKTVDFMRGYDIVVKALPSAYLQILKNAGEEGVNYLHFINNPEDRIGFNAKTMNVEDLIESGVIDPVKVTRSAIENAISIASMILTTECVITTDNDTPQQEQQNLF